MSKNNTLEVYKKQILTKFAQEKSGANADFCFNTSPANFRKWCCLVFESGLNKNDEEIFKKFFNWKENEDKFQKIKNFDIDKFRPFQNFLTKNTEISQLESLNLIAVLLNFKPRPFSKFRLINNIDEVTVKEAKFSISENVAQPISNKNKVQEVTKPKIDFKKVAIVLSICLTLVFIIKWQLPDKKCMIWQKNHYESIDCDNIKQGIIANNPIAIDQNDLDNFKKIDVNQSTVFFKNNQPCVWYGKSIYGNYEFFTSCGLHPETGKTLKPISKYIIKKYVLTDD